MKSEIQTGHISKFTPNVKDPSFSVYKKGQAHPQFLCKKWYGIQTGQYFIVHTNYQAPFHFLCKKGHGIQIGQYFNVHSNFQAPPILFKKCHGIQIGQYFYVHSNCQVTPPPHFCLKKAMKSRQCSLDLYGLNFAWVCNKYLVTLAMLTSNMALVQLLNLVDIISIYLDAFLPMG